MKHLFIINPKSCRGKGLKYGELIKKYFENINEPYFIEFTKGIGDATKIAAEYSAKDTFRIYSIGGDGTLNEVLNGMVNTSSSLAVIPAGSGNDFFGNIDGSIEPNILSRTIKGTEKYIDLGKVNDRYFLSVASAGIDAEIAKNSDRFRKLPLSGGMTSYIAGIFYTVFRFKSFKTEIIIDDLELSKDTHMLAVANGKTYGGGMKIAPKADITDGLFEVYHVDKINPIKILMLFPKLIKGVHETIKEVTYYRAKKINVRSEQDFSLNIDGEIFTVKEATFEIIPNGLMMVFPTKIKFD